jgi:hypothetical protein
MSKQEHLFDLIHSMNRTEKGYFKKMYAEKGLARPNRYLELFDLIDRQKSYNEKPIADHFYKQKVFKQLSVAKNYLASMLKKSLRAYNSKNSVNIELNERMINVEILFNKGLYPAVGKEIRKVEQMIDEHEAFHRFPELATWKKYLLDKTVDQRQLGELRQAIHGKEVEMIEKARVFAEISNLNFQFLSVYLRVGTVRNKTELREYQTIMKNPILRDEAKLNSLGSWYYFHDVHSMFFDTIRDFNNFHYHTDCFVKLMEENPKHIQRDLPVYVSSCFNRLLSLVKLKDDENYHRCLAEFQKISRKWKADITPEYASGIKVYEVNANMWHMRAKGQFDQMEQLGEELEKHNDEVVYIYPFSVLYSEIIYLTTYAAFANGNFRKAIRKLNVIISNSLREQREDVACYAMILNMMCHYELGNYEYMESSMRSTYRFLVKLEKIYAFEKTLISFFRKLLKQNNLTDLTEFMEGFRTKLMEIENDLYEQTAFEYLDLISWLTAKIEDRKFKDVFTSRLK